MCLLQNVKHNHTLKKAVAEKLAESDYSEDELKEMLNNITDTEYFDIESRWVVCIAKGIVGK